MSKHWNDDDLGGLGPLGLLALAAALLLGMACFAVADRARRAWRYLRGGAR